jgi:hypothetical protein
MDSSRVADHRAWKEACRGRVSATWWNSKMRPPTADRSVTPISMSNEHETATALATEEGLHHRDSWKFDIRKLTEDGSITNQNIETTLSLNPPTPRPRHLQYRFCKHGRTRTDNPCCDRNVDLQGLAANPRRARGGPCPSAWTS